MINWTDYFVYDETSPSCLRWKVSVRTGKGYNIEVVGPGDVAGSLNGKGYFVVSLGSVSYGVNRVVWEMLKGPIPIGYVVDHIDRKKGNNRSANLRLVSNAINSRNAGMSKNNTSGVNGVSFRKRIRYCKIEEYWEATWKELDGKQRSKSFSVAVHGDKAFDLACKARKEAVDKLNTQGAGYSLDHGQPTKGEIK